MSPIEMLRHAAALSEDDVSVMAAALGWPTVERLRAGEPFSINDYCEPANFWVQPEDRQRFEPFAVWMVGTMSMTDAGRCVVALRLLAEDAAGDD